jgi:hypothetical protein
MQNSHICAPEPGSARDLATQHYGRQVDVNGIEKPELQALLGDAGSPDHDVLVAGDLPCDVDGLRDSLGDERM